MFILIQISFYDPKYCYTIPTGPYMKTKAFFICTEIHYMKKKYV